MEHSNFVKLISNYGTKLWSMISVFIFIPLYIQYLGTENYGLIGFYALLLGIISFADSGMSSSIIREFSQDVDVNYKYSLFKRFEFIYITVSLIISVIIFLFSNYIAVNWVTSQNIPKTQLVYYIKLIGFGITSQFLSTLYYGALFGSNMQVRSNMLQLLWSISRSALVFILFFIFYSSIEIYFAWQIVCNLVYIFILRFFIIKQLRKMSTDSKLAVQFKTLPKHITSYIGAMIFIAIISAINIQADKLVTSTLFDLSTFGFYNIASSIAQLPVIFTAPLIAFAFPLFSKFSNSEHIEDKEKNRIVFEKIFYLINLIGVLISITIIFYAENILILWTKNMIPQDIFPAIIFDIRVLIIGSFLMSLQFPFFYLLLSKGKTKYTIVQGLAQVLIGLPLLYYFTDLYGLYGVPFVWLFINLFALTYLNLVVQKKYLQFSEIKFYVRLFCTPILVTILINYIVYLVYLNINKSFIFFAALGCILSFLLCIFLHNFLYRKKIISINHLYDFPNE